MNRGKSWLRRGGPLAVFAALAVGYALGAAESEARAKGDKSLLKNPPAAVADGVGRTGFPTYLDTGLGGRKKQAAARMTRVHEEMAELGYTFVDMEILSENADVQGFLLSYVAESRSR